jgi:hypothetical protein
MSKKILKLPVQNEFDFFLAGLISGYKDYRLCFDLNNALQLNFLRGNDVVLPAGKPGSSTRHSYFTGEGKDGEMYHVISNRDKDGTGYFIPEMKNIDYFLVVSAAPPGFRMDALVKTTRQVEIISGVYDLDPTELKSAETFLLFLEV